VAWVHVFAVLQLVLAMVGMGLGLAPRDFAAVASAPRALVVGCLAQLVLVPALALALASMLGLSPGATLGLVLIAAVPAGSLANLFTAAAGGRAALTISLVALETAAAVVVTPLLLRLGAGGILPSRVVVPVGAIGRDVGVDLLAPLVAGMALRRWRPAWSPRLARYFLRGAGAALALFVVTTIAARHEQLAASGPSSAVAVGALAAGVALLGGGVSRVCRLERPDRISVALSLAMRNTNLALLLAATMLDDVPGAGLLEAEALYAAIVFGGVSLAVGGAYAACCRFGAARR
jgi:BASS family bile acid:Na+ symporter